MATKAKEAAASPRYEPETIYTFRLFQTVKLREGGRYARSDQHEAKGELLNKIVDQEGEDAVDTAYAIE